MKSRFLILSLVVLAPLLLIACIPAGKETAIAVNCDEFAKQKAVTKDLAAGVGDNIKLSLCSNRTTGFSWAEKSQISDNQVLEQTGHDFITPVKDSKLVGAPGTEVWTFKALKAGKSTVHVDYDQPWQGGQKAAWTFTLNITVQ